MRRTLPLVLAAFVGCSPAAPNQEQTLQNLKAQADSIRHAALNEDHEEMAAFTYPAVVEAVGGRAKFVQKLEKGVAEMRAQGFKFKDIALGEPSGPVEASGELYAVVPERLELTGPRGASGTTASYLIGVSGDRGVSWKFIDGNGVAGDRKKLKQVLPHFPDGLDLPAGQKPVWKDE
jgi:hypothetical protein